ncbi:MAG: methyltransferase [Hyphomicrobiaceae bacterium]
MMSETPQHEIPPDPSGGRLRTVEPEVWDPSLIGDQGWRDLRDGKPRKPKSTYRTYLDEEHHRFYGRPWAVGRTYYDFLVEMGLKASDHVLDFGCGAGRLGIWLIQYLEAGHYVGTDHHWSAIEAFARYEVPLHDLPNGQIYAFLAGA